MKGYFKTLILLSAFAVLLTGCDEAANSSSEENSSSAAAATTTQEDLSGEESTPSEGDEASSEQQTGLSINVQFGDEGESYTLNLLDNPTAAAIYNHVGSSSWRLPIYNSDESEVMEYYDIPQRYEIPDNSEAVTSVKAGDVYYSHPNRIILYYRDTEINEEYTKVGTFEATEEFVNSVINNPVLEGWGNKIVVITQ